MPATYTPLSSITVNDIVGFLRVDSTELTAEELALLATITEAAKSYVLTYTGRTSTEADAMPEMTLAAYNLAQDMYDKRAYTVDSDKSSKVVDTILGMRSTNLL